MPHRRAICAVAGCGDTAEQCRTVPLSLSGTLPALWLITVRNLRQKRSKQFALWGLLDPSACMLPRNPIECQILHVPGRKKGCQFCEPTAFGSYLAAVGE